MNDEAKFQELLSKKGLLEDYQRRVREIEKIEENEQQFDWEDMLSKKKTESNQQSVWEEKLRKKAIEKAIEKEKKDKCPICRNYVDLQFDCSKCMDCDQKIHYSHLFQKNSWIKQKNLEDKLLKCPVCDSDSILRCDENIDINAHVKNAIIRKNSGRGLKNKKSNKLRRKGKKTKKRKNEKTKKHKNI
jgi:hypothetical protein